MGIDFDITPGSGVPIFRQVVDRVRLAAATGRAAPGEALPSVRALAERLVVNPNTIAKAYGELAREGVIDTRQGRGAVVAPPRQVYTKAERLRRIGPLLDALVNEGLSLAFTPDELLELLGRKLADAGVAQTPGRKTS